MLCGQVTLCLIPQQDPMAVMRTYEELKNLNCDEVSDAELNWFLAEQAFRRMVGLSDGSSDSSSQND